MKTLARARDAEEIRGRLLRVAADDVGRWGSMSVAEMVCHVRDAYEGAMGRRAVSAVTERGLMSPGLYKRMALSMPRWPPGVETMPEVNPRVRGSRPAEFAGDARAMLERFTEFVMFAGPWPAHPMFGAMTGREWKRWGYLHANHHLRQFGR